MVLILLLPLNGRMAFWVGIPVSLAATLGVLHRLGGSVNMIGLFARIMALGIIVDDAIVMARTCSPTARTAEERWTRRWTRRLLVPVFSSSLTAAAAFLPLMLIGGIIGTIL